MATLGPFGYFYKWDEKMKKTGGRTDKSQTKGVPWKFLQTQGVSWIFFIFSSFALDFVSGEKGRGEEEENIKAPAPLTPPTVTGSTACSISALLYQTMPEKAFKRFLAENLQSHRRNLAFF